MSQLLRVKAIRCLPLKIVSDLLHVVCVTVLKMDDVPAVLIGTNDVVWIQTESEKDRSWQ